MTPTRAAAAVAALITALLLQATIVGPLSLPSSATLPGLLVAVVAVRSGPATGMTFGFVTGLVADLASNHPAGVLALTWTLLGVVAGLVGTVPGHETRRRAAGAAAVTTTLATVVAGVLLTAAGQAGQGTQALRWSPATLLVELLLAFFLVPVVSAFLRARALRPRQVGPTAAAAVARRRAAGTGTAGDDVAAVQRG